MAYPEPTPVLKRRAATEFEERLKSFSLDDVQKKFYRGAKKLYERLKPKT